MAKAKAKKEVSKRDTGTNDENPCSVPEHSRGKLLKAAFDVFSQQGFHGTTTKKIAETAQVNEALIMRHFKSKEGLFLAVIEQNLTCEPTELPYPAQKTLEDELIQFADYILERDRKKNDFLRIVIGHSLQDKAFVCKADEQIIDKRKPLLSQRLEELQKQGKIPNKMNVEEIELAVGHQAFAANFFNRLIPIFNDELTREYLQQSVKWIAAGIVASK